MSGDTLRRRIARPIFRSLMAAHLAVAAAAPAAEAPDPPPPAQVEFSAPDGLMLHATYWAAAGPGPAMLLLHQCNADRTSWTPLAERFARAGVHVLAFDFRGFGGSRNDLVGDFSAERARLLPDFPADVDRAVSFFATLPDVDVKRLGVMGASCGGSQTVLLALREPRVQAIGFLSSSLPALTEQDLVQFESNEGLAILAIAAEKDAGTIEITRRLFDRSSHPDSKLIVYKGALHGVPLFEHDAGLADSIVAWFVAML
jgi:alpha-beta hydrolase superfamily lysophospholipase